MVLTRHTHRKCRIEQSIMRVLTDAVDECFAAEIANGKWVKFDSSLDNQNAAINYMQVGHVEKLLCQLQSCTSTAILRFFRIKFVNGAYLRSPMRPPGRSLAIEPIPNEI